MSRAIKDEQNLQHLIEAIPDPALIATQEGRICYANSLMERLFGYTGETLHGLTIEDLMPARYRERHQAHRRDYHAHPHTRLMGAVPDLYILRQDGSEFPVDISLSPIETKAGLLVLAIIRDVTRRKEAEELLMGRARKLEALARLSQQIVAGLALEGLMTETVTLLAQALGLSHVKAMECLPGAPHRLIVRAVVGWPEEWVGNLITNAEGDVLISQAMATLEPTHVTDAREDPRFQGSPWLGDVVSGVCVPIGCCTEPYCGHPVRGVLCAYANTRRTFSQDDISFICSAANTLALAFERVEAEARLRRLHNELLRQSRISAVGELGATLAHELNQPLAAVLNYLEACRRSFGQCDCPKEATLGTMIRKSEAEAERAVLILRRLRDFIEKGRVNLAAENLNTIVGDAARLAHAEDRGHNIEVRFELEPGLPPAFIDRVQIQQVVFNLARNAIEALLSADRRILTIRTGKREGEKIEVQVEDTGPGIEPGRLDQFFKTYHSTKQGGMGLGLSICYSIVGAHGGLLWVSETPGGGATFHFTVAIAEDSNDQ